MVSKRSTIPMQNHWTFRRYDESRLAWQNPLKLEGRVGGQIPEADSAMSIHQPSNDIFIVPAVA